MLPRWVTLNAHLVRGLVRLLPLFPDGVPPLEGRLRVAVGEALQPGAAAHLQVQEPRRPSPESNHGLAQSCLLCRLLRAPDVPGLVAHREGDGQLVAGAHVVARTAEVSAPVDLHVDEHIGYNQLSRFTMIQI